MTREEAITVLQDKHDECKAFYVLAAHPEDAYPGAKEYMEALQIAIAALRGPTREQVKKCFGGVWEFDDEDFDYDWYCVKCECPTNVRPNFCPRCGSAMTDKAVDVVMKRLEALKDGAAD